MCTRKGYAASVSQLRWQRLRYISRFSNRRLGAKDPLPSRRRFIQSFPSTCKIPIIKQYITVSGVNQEIPLGDSGIPKFPGSRIAVVESGKKKNGQFVCLHKRKNRFL